MTHVKGEARNSRPRGFTLWHAQPWLQGGTRGAIAQARAVTGYWAAATSHGNDERAAAFGQETGVAVFTSAFNVVRLIIEGMLERGFGRIVQIASHQWPRGRTGSRRDRWIRTNAVHREGSEILHGFAGP